jgi:hypothetical protein
VKIALAGLVFLAVYGLVGCCSDRVLLRLPSPDGLVVVTLFDRDCGATADYSTNVSLGRPSDGRGNDAFFIFVAKGRREVSIRWAGAKSLYVECDRCSRDTIFRQVTTLGDIDVHYSLPAAP